MLTVYKYHPGYSPSPQADIVCELELNIENEVKVVWRFLVVPCLSLHGFSFRMVDDVHLIHVRGEHTDVRFAATEVD